MIHILAVFTFLSLSSLNFAAIQFVYNPNCPLPECLNPDLPGLYYANTTIDNDQIHVVYSSLDDLTISIFQTQPDCLLTFNYTELFHKNYRGAIQFNGMKPVDSFTIIVRRLIQFNDTDNNGILNDRDNITGTYHLRNLIPVNSSTALNSTDQPMFEFPLEMLNGTLEVDIVYPGQSQRDSKFPKLRTDSKSIFLNIALNASSYADANTRFAFEFYLISPSSKGLETSSSRYIDDHFTPGIFNVWQMKTLDSMYPASMLWKPVVYQSKERTIEQNTLMKIYPLQNNVTYNSSDDTGIFYSILPYPIMSALNISLGQAGDGFFAQTNYTFIQFTAGLNTLVPDSTAVFVTVALIISFALPGIVGAVALILMLKRRFSSNKPSAYGTLSN